MSVHEPPRDTYTPDASWMRSRAEYLTENEERKARRARRGIGFFGVTLIVLLALLVGVVGTLLALAFLAPQPTSPKIAVPTAHDLTVSVDDAFLTQQVTDGLAKATLPMKVSNVVAHVAENATLDLSGDLPDAPHLSGTPARTFSAVLSLAVQDDTLTAQVQSITFGALVLPEAVVTAFKSSLASAFDSAGASLAVSSQWTLSELSTVGGC